MLQVIKGMDAEGEFVHVKQSLERSSLELEKECRQMKEFNLLHDGSPVNLLSWRKKRRVQRRFSVHTKGKVSEAHKQKQQDPTCGNMIRLDKSSFILGKEN